MNKGFKRKIKNIISVFVHVVTRVFCIFPIDKKKIVFEAYMGKQYSCNPKYLCEYIDGNDDTYKLIWVYYKNKLECKYPQIKRNSVLYFYHYLTAGIVIYNSGLNHLIKFRKNQIAINTWHGGGAYKGMPRLDEDIYNRENDFFLSSSELSSKYVIRYAMNFYGRILETGLPRNDILINYDTSNITNIKKKLNISNERCVLYAPTFRADLSKVEFKLDYSRLVRNLEKKFGEKWIVLYRGHYNMEEISSTSLECAGMINVTSYPDMQELLLIADVLITDYSGSIWDYSFLQRPIFLYTTDLGDYNIERSFFVDIHKWGFPICENNDDLENAIMSFDKEDSVRSIREHHKLMGSYEKGNACKQVYGIINNLNR